MRFKELIAHQYSTKQEVPLKINRNFVLLMIALQLRLFDTPTYFFIFDKIPLDINRFLVGFYANPFNCYLWYNGYR